ncbi:MAG: EF-hand domain-containing protein, partial [Planctomycetota bacterium]|nr:EF-hand domain-containing protein [Planctomycetota bacterium]
MAQPPQGGPGRPGGGFGGGEGFRIPNPLLQALDKDKDGTLSADEIENAAAALKTLDKNNDGKIDQSETRPNFEGMGRGGFGGPPGGGPPRGGGPGDGGDAQMVQRLMEMDANKDGKLSKDELPERMQSMLTRGDKNKDGVLDKEEIMASFRERSGGQEGGGPFGGGPFGGGPEFIAQLFERADADKDGELKGEEIPPFMRERLEQIDSNKDGSLDKAE